MHNQVCLQSSSLPLHWPKKLSCTSCCSVSCCSTLCVVRMLHCKIPDLSTRHKYEPQLSYSRTSPHNCTAWSAMTGLNDTLQLTLHKCNMQCSVRWRAAHSSTTCSSSDGRHWSAEVGLAGGHHLRSSRPLVQSLPLGLWDLPKLLGDDGNVVVRHILKEVLDGLLVVQGPQTLGGVKVGVAGEQDVVACRWDMRDSNVQQDETSCTTS